MMWNLTFEHEALIENCKQILSYNEEFDKNDANYFWSN